MKTEGLSSSSQSLVRHDDQLWSVEHEFSWQAGLIPIPVRMTVLRLSDRRLILHSPIPITGTLQSALEQLGEVAYLVVPRAHGRFAAEAARVFPAAELLAAPNASFKRRGLPFTGSVGDSTPPTWNGEIEAVRLQGFRLEEVVFYQPSSRSLVVTDLCFNIQETASRIARTFFRLNGMWRVFGPSRLIRSLAVSHRAAFHRSLETVLEKDFLRVVPGHGALLENAKSDHLRRAWGLPLAKGR